MSLMLSIMISMRGREDKSVNLKKREKNEEREERRKEKKREETEEKTEKGSREQICEGQKEESRAN